MNPQRANVVLGIAIAILLIGLCLAGIRHLRVMAVREETRNNLRMVASAIHSYAERESDRLPPAFDRGTAVPYPVSIHVHILPHVGQSKLFDTFLTEGNGNEDAVVPAYLAPDDGTLLKKEGVQNFAANLRLFSHKGSTTPASADMPQLGPVERGGIYKIGNIPKGTSQTIAFATKLAHCGNGGSRYAASPASPWAGFFGQNAATTTAHYSNPRAIYQWAPRCDECLTSPLMAQTYSPRPILAAMLDGAVREIRGDLSPEVWNAALSPD
jgi:hypothetical protein